MRLKNLFNMGWGTLRGNIANSRTPLNIMLSVTNRCTSNCVYCNIPGRPQRELTTEEIFELINQASTLGAQRLGLWGGEPLIRDDIGRIIDYAKNKGLFVTLDSNGYLAEERLECLKNLDHFVLALDGPLDAHERNRGAGSFQKAMKALKLLRGKVPVWTITVLTKHNLESIDFILEMAKNFDALATFQVLHHNEILGKNSESLLPSEGLYREAIKKLIDKKKTGSPIASSLRYLERLSNWPDYRKPALSHPVDSLKCWAGRLYCNVDTDGSVYPCSLLIGKMKALNYLEAGFKKAFDYIRETPCASCNASCFTEYNYLYSLDLSAVTGWLKAIHVSRRRPYANK